MDCRELRDQLPELLAESLDTVHELAAEAHLRKCADCAREVKDHRRAWKLLGVLDGDGELPVVRLEQMAAATLDRARVPATAGAAGAATGRAGDATHDATHHVTHRHMAPIFTLRRGWPRVAASAAAAALLIAATFGVRIWMQEGGSGALPRFLDDPEFVTNFEVIRDLPDLDAQGELLDLDDELLVLDAMRGA